VTTVAPLAPTLSEADFQTTVIGLAKLHGWLVFHPRPSLNRRGKWSTATQGHTGFPDLTIARHGVVLHVELKTERGRLSTAQRLWASAMGDTYRLWRPSMWAAIYDELTERTSA